MKRPVLKLSLLLVSLLSVPFASAASVATWDFEGSTLDNALQSRTASAGVTASVVGHNNLNNVLRNNVNYPTLALTVSPAVAQSSYGFSTAIANASYLTVSITVAEGSVLTIDGISLQAASGTSNNPDTSVRAFYVLSSLTGFAAEPANILLQDSVADGMGSRATGLSDHSVTLTSPAFQNIAGGTSVEFRIYIQTAGTTQNIEFDNISISGSLSSIPEPGSAALLAGIIACGFVCTRRRRTAA